MATTAATITDKPTDPNAGASTGGGEGLSVMWIAIIVVLIIVVLAVLVAICLVCYYKKANTDENKVAPAQFDARPQAPLPDTGNIEYPDSSSYTGLIMDPSHLKKTTESKDRGAYKPSSQIYIA